MGDGFNALVDGWVTFKKADGDRLAIRPEVTGLSRPFQQIIRVELGRVGRILLDRVQAQFFEHLVGDDWIETELIVVHGSLLGKVQTG